MQTCPKCGSYLRDDAAFCAQCGASLAKQAPASGGFCTNCGTKLSPGSRFCVNCGSPVAQAPAAAPGVLWEPAPTPDPQPVPAPPVPDLEVTIAAPVIPEPTPIQASTQVYTPRVSVDEYTVPAGVPGWKPATQPEAYGVSQKPQSVPEEPNPYQIPLEQAFSSAEEEPNPYRIPQEPVGRTDPESQIGWVPPEPPDFLRGPEIEEEPEKKGPKWLVSVCAALVGVLVIALLVSLVVVPKLVPQELKFLQAQGDLIADRLMLDTDAASKWLDKGEFSSDMKLTASIDHEEADEILGQYALMLKLDANKKRVLMNASLMEDSDDLLDARLGLDLKDYVLSGSLPAIDNRCFQLEAKDLEVLEEYWKVKEEQDQKAYAKQVEKVGKDLAEIFYENLLKDKLQEEKRRELELSNLHETYRCDIYTLSPQTEDLENALTAAADYLRNSADAVEILYYLRNDAMVVDALEYDYDFEPITRMDAQEDLEELADILEDGAEELEDLELEWTLAKEKDVVRMIRLKTTGGTLVYECAGEEKNGFEEVLVSRDSAGGRVVLLEHEFTDEDKNRSGELVLMPEEYGSLRLRYDADREDRSVLGLQYGEYVLEVEDSAAKMILDVARGAGGDDYQLTIPVEDQKVKVMLHATDKSTAAEPEGKRKDLTNANQEDLDEIAMDLEEGLTDLIEDNSGGLEDLVMLIDELISAF